MTFKQFKVVKLSIVIILSILVAQFVVSGNFIGPIIVVAIASVFLFYSRSRVKEVVADERDYAIGGKAARWAIQIYSWVTIVVMFTLYAKQDIGSAFGIIAQTLAYSICFLLIAYAVIFRYLNGHEKSH